MAEQILVPLKRNDRVEVIIPYLEKVTQPGMRVVFLAHYPVDRLMINYRGDLRSRSAAGEIHDSEINWWRDRRVSMEVVIQTRLAMGLPASCPLRKQSPGGSRKTLPSV
jgi:hypothetical protein